MNKDEYRSLSRMLEEIKQLTKPIAEQLKLQTKMEGVASSIQRITEINTEILAGAVKIDTGLAEKIRALVTAYQPLLDEVEALENLMSVASFAELVKPQLYIPGFSADLVEGIAKPWQTETKVISDMNLAGLTTLGSEIGRLCSMEREIAGLSKITEQYEQITSVSAQIASLAQINLTDSWKQAIVPSALISGLNQFSLKQYGIIQKASDPKEIAWRFGLINTASRIVDQQVSWGTELATESEAEAPDTETAVPDLSELPVLLSSAKRDDKSVEEVFKYSGLNVLTEKAKIIYEKAKHINDLCKLKGQEELFPGSNLGSWGIELAGAFCRDAESLNDVVSILRTMFVQDPVFNMLGNKNALDLLIECEEREKKGIITKKQGRIYDQVIAVENRLIEILERMPIRKTVNEEKISTDVFRALLNAQRNPIYIGQKENTINDGIRDMLDGTYGLKDQTRQGVSESGKDAGEIDLMLYSDGLPIALMEGMKLNYVNTTVIDKHINKALVNYDPIGCPLVYILMYVTSKKFDEFWEKVVKHLRMFKFSYELLEGIREISTAYTDSRHGKLILQRNGKRVNVHVYAMAMK